MAMNSPSTNTSSQSRCQLMCPRTFLFFSLFVIFSISSVSSARAATPYAPHCASIVPESTPTSPDFTSFPFLLTQNSYYTGGERILGKKSSQFSFYGENYRSFRITGKVHKTKTSGVYQIQARLIFYTYSQSYYPKKLIFLMNGFWSEFSGKLCMLGSASWSREGNSLNLDAVLKLNSAKNSTISTSLVSGTLESLSSLDDPNYFETVSMLAVPPMSSYNYTLVSEGFDNGCPGGIDIPQDLSLSLHPRLCSILSQRFHTFELEYGSKCNSSQNCTPFVEGIGYLPGVMSLSPIQCSEEKQSLRYLVGFPNSSYTGYYYYPSSSNLNATLVGEGSWDKKRNQLCIAACRILNVTDSFGKAHVGDCSIRLSLRFPAVWSIRNMSGIVGQIWTNKTAKDPGYFDRIKFRSFGNDVVNDLGLKYEYTEIERARSSCPVKKPLKNKKVRYPSANSFDMRLDMNVKDSKGNFAWGSAVPVSVDDQFYGNGDLYVKKHPDVLPSISVVMLVILTLGHMIPLVLNFEALLLPKHHPRSVMLRSGGWIEVNEVIVRVVTMAAFLLQCRLLHLSWSARLGDGNKKGFWDAEKKVLFVSSPLYLVGGLIAFFVNWMKNKSSTTMLWGALRSYAGLILDGFLFPQILFNAFQISTESALSRSFYIGTTFVRLLPHAYDLYRAHSYVQRQLDVLYFYANPSADFYSTVWDIIIPLGGMLLAVILYLQQKFGGRCVLPRKYRELEAYEKVPVVSNE
ncbi:hypothetical protein F0562_010323 [Nyssa sinensis]|uniref:RING-type E3 ubiquitin transferase n=1 Tax=Nyssa sinensis TaxID=561372 RepID=A0A5J5A090_9ASTE|nr:hypothetical protein F0562_010323 [Nyssa sinensis]